MNFKKIALIILFAASLIQQSNAMILSKENVTQFVTEHKSLLKKLTIASMCGLGLYVTYKIIKNKIVKLLETEDKDILVYDDGIVIKERTYKNLPHFGTSYFMMYMHDKNIGLLTSAKIENQFILGDFFISKEFQNKGYGQRLLKIAIETLTKRGVNEIYLDANPFEKNVAGVVKVLPTGLERDEKLQKLVKFYEQNNFTVIDKELAKNKVTLFRFMPLSCPMQYKAS